MEVYLTIDRGNTALKTALWSANGDLLRNNVSFDGLPAAELARALLSDDEHIAGIAYCTVVASARTTDLDDLQAALGVPALNVDSSVGLPMRICYSSMATLGADRIAAAAGALCYVANRPVLVADIGTAVTYDFVDSEGRYLGGNIAPGISMRLHALHAHTSALPAVDPRGIAPVWGTTTEQALRSGTLRGVAAELEYYRRQAGHDAALVLTGGSVPILAAAHVLDFDYIHDPCLVHRGLYSILRYNER